MSKSILSKSAAILVGLSLLSITAYPAFGLDSTSSAVKPLPPASNQFLQQRVQAQKDNVAAKITSMREQAASKAAALKARLQTFKDQKKAEIADRVNTNLNRINQNQTSQMQKNLATMSGILDKLEARVNQATPDIKDPTSAKASIASARAAISTASAAVTAQAQKDYTVTVTFESRIKMDVKTQRDALHTDLLAVRKQVIEAKQAVAHAIRVAKSGPSPVGKEVTEKEGSSSGQQ